MALIGDGWVAAESSCCRRMSGGSGPSGERSPTSGEVTTVSSVGEREHRVKMVLFWRRQSVGLESVTHHWGWSRRPAPQAGTGSDAVCPGERAELELPSGCRVAAADSAAGGRPPGRLRTRDKVQSEKGRRRCRVLNPQQGFDHFDKSDKKVEAADSGGTAQTNTSITDHMTLRTNTAEPGAPSHMIT